MDVASILDSKCTLMAILIANSTTNLHGCTIPQHLCICMCTACVILVQLPRRDRCRDVAWKRNATCFLRI